MVLTAGGGIMVADAGELPAAVRQLVDSAEKRQALGRAGYELIAQNRGATAFTLEMIRDVLAGGDPEQWENRRKATVT